MSDLTNAIKQICEEKGLSYEAVIATIESALAAAYRKDYGEKNQNIKVEFNPETTKSKVFDVKTVVEDMPEEEPSDAEAMEGDGEASEKFSLASDKVKKDDVKKREKVGKSEKKQDEEEKVKSKEEPSSASGEATEDEEEERKFNPKTEIQITDAKLIKKTAKVGDEIKMKFEVPESYGRMAAQTAKQVIIQRLREAEREMIFNDFKEKEHEVVSGVVQRREGRIVLIDLGRSVGVLPPEEQIPGEQYRTGERIKVFVKEVNSKSKGPEVLLSRTSDEILKKVFYLEIPEISNGLIELKEVAREAGSRSKVAVWTDSDNVDPIGSCVGQRGARIQTIISELGGEKVDIIEYDEDAVRFISNALSPAKILNIEIEEKENKAKVMVSNDQLSLAIGKSGQNARLAAKLTGWKIDIVEAKEDKPSSAKATEDKPSSAKATEDKPVDAQSSSETKKDKKEETKGEKESLTDLKETQEEKTTKEKAKEDKKATKEEKEEKASEKKFEKEKDKTEKKDDKSSSAKKATEEKAEKEAKK